MESAISILRDFEGFRETPYWDVNAYRVGYGSDTITTADGRVIPVRQGMRVTREDAERDLARRVRSEFMPRAAQAVGPDIFNRLAPNQQAALVSLTYNYGSLPGGVARAVAAGDMTGAVAAIQALRAHNDGINASRREREAAIFGGSGQGWAGLGVPQMGAPQPAPTNALADQPQPIPQPPEWRNSLNVASFLTPRRANALLPFQGLT